MGREGVPKLVRPDGSHYPGRPSILLDQPPHRPHPDGEEPPLLRQEEVVADLILGPLR